MRGGPCRFPARSLMQTSRGFVPRSLRRARSGGWRQPPATVPGSPLRPAAASLRGWSALPVCGARLSGAGPPSRLSAASVPARGLGRRRAQRGRARLLAVIAPTGKRGFRPSPSRPPPPGAGEAQGDDTLRRDEGLTNSGAGATMMGQGDMKISFESVSGFGPGRFRFAPALCSKKIPLHRLKSR